ncbi:unnamed protein product, partial [Mesorhabditis spiculigera]
MGYVVVIAVMSLFLLALFFFIKHLALRRQLAGIHSPRSYPLIGQALIIKPDAEGFMDQIMGMGQLYPTDSRMVLFWIGPKPALMIYSAELAERIVCSSKHLNKGFAYNLLEPWLGLSLLTSNAERWRPKRKLLTPTFHYDILKDFVPVFNEHSLTLVKKLATVPKGECIDFCSYVTLCALDIICETSMGKRVNAQIEANSQYVKAVYEINDIVQTRTKNPLMWNKWAFDTFGEGKAHDACLATLHGFTGQVIAQRERELEAAEWQLEGRLAFLDLLLDMAHQGQIDHGDIQAEVDTFMFEGHDTTSTALSWAAHLLGNHPDILHQAQLEVDMVFAEYGEVNATALSKLDYLERCIKETLRLYPSVPTIMRELGSDQELAGRKIPAGMQIILNPYLIHRDPAQWPEPEKFDPDRFLPENSVNRHAFALIPFSAGSRNCIGQRFAYMEMKTVLAWLLHYFDIESVDRRCDVSHKMELILRPAEGIRVRLPGHSEVRCQNCEMPFRLLLFVVLLVAVNGDATCPQGTLQVPGRQYCISFTDELSFGDAQQACSDKGATLYEPIDTYDDKLIGQMMQNYSQARYAWIGILEEQGSLQFASTGEEAGRKHQVYGIYPFCSQNVAGFGKQMNNCTQQADSDTPCDKYIAQMTCGIESVNAVSAEPERDRQLVTSFVNVFHSYLKPDYLNKTYGEDCQQRLYDGLDTTKTLDVRVLLRGNGHLYLADAATTAAGICTSPMTRSCDPGWSYLASSNACYAAANYSESITQEQAESICQGAGGNLVSITGISELLAVLGMVSEAGEDVSYWTGLTCSGGTWQWTDNSTIVMGMDMMMTRRKRQYFAGSPGGSTMTPLVIAAGPESLQSQCTEGAGCMISPISESSWRGSIGTSGLSCSSTDTTGIICKMQL